MRILYFALLSVPLTAQVQRFTFGLTGGVPLGKMVPSFGREESRRYTFGPLVEVSLAEPITIAVNPLYKRTGASLGPYSSLSPPIEFHFGGARFRSHSLELPLIGKYSFGNTGKRWRPFVGSGFSFQAAWQTTEQRGILRNTETNDVRSLDLSSDHQRTPTDVGAVASAGIAMPRGRIEFVPEIRYTRWGSATRARDRHQTEFLFSIRF